MSIELAKWIPWLPAIGAVLCGLCCTKRSLRKFAGPICILSIFGAFLIAVAIRGFVPNVATAGQTVHLFDWIHVGDFKVDFGFFIDPLTMIMLFVVTGVGTLVAIYASGYMAGDRGYARFFAAVCLFIFAMTTLVLADNLVLLYLGWEGVGLCSYLLIGYYYNKPSAVAAAKKAFIVNRIGDLGFALGIFLIYQSYGTVRLSEIIAQAEIGGSSDALANTWIPFLLMLGAFGKSAQLPLYVWLPDAMEGPTPVSALIHAATMVTAGVYMIARLLPVFELSPAALPTVAAIGGLTALFAASIALCQYDIKRIYAYSTISQLGYMFMAVGVATTESVGGGVFHLFTHAFFKALLFLTAGSVMHGLAGQLDLRKMSGLRTKMPVTCWLMFIGCLALAGFPFTAGFYSKDMILAATLGKGLEQNLMPVKLLGVLGLVTAFLTAYYTFRLWFRVFMGPTQYELGDEHHGHEEENGHDHAHGHGDDHGQAKIHVEHHHDVHDVGWMNLPLVVLALGALFAGWYFHHILPDMVNASTARARHGAGHPHGVFLEDLHTEMMLLSSIIAISGILIAAYFHWLNRPAADRLASQFKGLVRLLANKYYVDEINDALIVKPLRMLGEICLIFDRVVIGGLVLVAGMIPNMLGRLIQPSQRGVLQGYGLGMVAGVAIVVLLIVYAT